MRVEDILPLLKNVKHGEGQQWSARCPAHDDLHNSLSLGEARDGKLLLYCHAGCKFSDIKASLIASGYIEQPNMKSDFRPDTEATGIYNYRDEQGVLLYQVLRFANPKEFRPRVPDGNGGFKRGLPKDVRRILYRLPEILTSDSATTIFIVEGEKDVETLRSHGLVATCNVHGAGKWREEYNEPLRDRHVCILPDHDKPGIKHAHKVASSLYGVAASVRIVDLFNIN